MIDDRTDYLYVTPPESVQIDGGIMPLRTTDARVLRGEDAAFLAEAIAERSMALFGTLSPSYPFIPQGAWNQSPSPRLAQIQDLRTAFAAVENVSRRWILPSYTFAEARNVSPNLYFNDVYSAAFVPSSAWRLPATVGRPLGADVPLRMFDDVDLMVRAVEPSPTLYHGIVDVVYTIQDDEEGERTNTWTDPAHDGLAYAQIQQPSMALINGQFVEGRVRVGRYEKTYCQPRGAAYTVTLPHNLPFGARSAVPVMQVDTRCYSSTSGEVRYRDFVIPTYSPPYLALPYTLFEDIAQSHPVDTTAEYWHRSAMASIPRMIVDWDFPARTD